MQCRRKLQISIRVHRGNPQRIRAAGKTVHELMRRMAFRFLLVPARCWSWWCQGLKRLCDTCRIKSGIWDDDSVPGCATSNCSPSSVLGVVHQSMPPPLSISSRSINVHFGRKSYILSFPPHQDKTWGRLKARRNNGWGGRGRRNGTCASFAPFSRGSSLRNFAALEWDAEGYCQNLKFSLSSLILCGSVCVCAGGVHSDGW